MVPILCTLRLAPKVYNKTISGKIVERFADKVIVQWPEMVDVYKGHAEYYGTLV